MIIHMHSRPSRIVTLLAILICLPLQGLAAVTMPSCQIHDQKTEMHFDANNSQSMAHCSHHHDDRQKSKNSSCNKCINCYLVATAIIPFSMLLIINGVTPLVAAPVADIPDSLQTSLFHPPRYILA
jgi:hypothetical protein